MASQPPPPLYSDPKPPLEKTPPLTPSEQLVLRKYEMALECAEIQHLRDIAVLGVNRLRAEIMLRIETEMEWDREAERERDRERQGARDSKETLDWVLDFILGFMCVVLIFLFIAAVVMGTVGSLQRMACLFDL